MKLRASLRMQFPVLKSLLRHIAMRTMCILTLSSTLSVTKPERSITVIRNPFKRCGMHPTNFVCNTACL